MSSQVPVPVCVLAAEGAPDDRAVRRLGADRTLDARCIVPLALTAVSTLTFSRSAAGFDNFEFQTALAGPFGEADLVARIDRCLRSVHDADGRLLTFGGTSKSLPLLAARADRHMMFGALHLPNWSPGGLLHQDLAGGGPGNGARASGLGEACRAMALPFDLRRGRATLSGTGLRSRRDVLAIYLLHLYVLAREERSSTPVVEGRAALSSFLSRADVEPELLGFTDRGPGGGLLREGPDDAHLSVKGPR